MKNINALITRVCRPTGLGVLACLKGCSNITTIGVDRITHKAGMQLCRNYEEVVPSVSNPEYLAIIKDVIQKRHIDVVIPTQQEEIGLFHENPVGAAVLLPKSEHYDCLLSKLALYKHLEGVCPEIILRYLEFEDSSDLIRIRREYFPDDDRFCVKNISGHAGIGFAVLTDDPKVVLTAVGKDTSRVVDLAVYSSSVSTRRMAMEYLRGKEYSVDILIHNHKVISCVPRLRRNVATGVVINGILEKNEVLIDYSGKIALDHH